MYRDKSSEQLLLHVLGFNKDVNSKSLYGVSWIELLIENFSILKSLCITQSNIYDGAFIAKVVSRQLCLRKVPS